MVYYGFSNRKHDVQILQEDDGKYVFIKILNYNCVGANFNLNNICFCFRRRQKSVKADRTMGTDGRQSVKKDQT